MDGERLPKKLMTGERLNGMIKRKRDYVNEFCLHIHVNEFNALLEENSAVSELSSRLT